MFFTTRDGGIWANVYDATGVYTQNEYLVSDYKGEWISLKVPGPAGTTGNYVFRGIRIQTNSGHTVWRPKGFRVYGRNGAGLWTALHTVTNAAYSGFIHESFASDPGGVIDTFGIVTNITNTVGSTANYLVIIRLWFYLDYIVPTPAPTTVSCSHDFHPCMLFVD
jgi:hypothetical protein